MKTPLVLLSVLTLSGCLGAPGSEGSALLETAECEIAGAGTLAEGDSAEGSVRGDEFVVTGSWTHVTDTGAVIETTPDFIFCRINGVTVGDIGGRATIDGAGDYEFRAQVEDRGQPGPVTQNVTASRFYSPSEWIDGSLDVDGTSTVVIPESIPVVVGNAGNQWLHVDLVQADGTEASCRYRGGASRPNPSNPADIEAGLAYHFVRCTCGTGNDIEAGDEVEVSELTVHVQSGSHRFPTRADAETTVSVDFEIADEVQRDAYRMIIFNDDGTRLLTHEGDLASGDFTLTTH